MMTIERVRERCGAPGARRKSELAKITFPVRPPYATGGGPAAAMFTDWYALVQEGVVCWGYFVVADGDLFVPDAAPVAPAIVIWSVDPFVDRFPYWLSRPAAHLSHYRDRDTLPPQPPQAHHCYLRIRGDVFRHGNVRLPPHMTDGRAVYQLTVNVFPEHLPRRFLAGKLVPLLVLHKRGYADTGMVLPSTLWPAELRRAWGERR